MKITLDYVSNSSSSSFVFGKPGENDWSIERVAELYRKLEKDWLDTIYDLDAILQENDKAWAFVKRVRKDPRELRGADNLKFSSGYAVYYALEDWIKGDRTKLSRQFPVLSDDMLRQIQDRTSVLPSEMYDDFYLLFFDPERIKRLEDMVNAKNQRKCILGSGAILDCRGLQYNREKTLEVITESDEFDFEEFIGWYGDIINQALEERIKKQLGEGADATGFLYAPEQDGTLNNILLRYEILRQLEISQEKELLNTGGESGDYLEMWIRIIHETLGQVIIFGGRDSDAYPFDGIQRYLEKTLDYACIHMG